MTIRRSLVAAERRLDSVGISSARLDSELLLAHCLKQNREWLIAHDQDELTKLQAERYELAIVRRLDREPVCYITNQLEFYGIDFFVDNRVLSPRVETELIVEQAIELAKPGSKLIDLGTGSGAIAIAIVKHRPDLLITATEVSGEAMQVAKRNASSILGASNKIKFIKADVWAGVVGQFDTIVTNLPYVSKSYLPNMKPEVQKEPAVALFGGEGDGLDLYRRFYADLSTHTTADSIVLHESDPWQHDQLKLLANQAGLALFSESYLILGFKKPAKQ